MSSFNQMVDRPSYTGRSPSAISDYEYTVLAAISCAKVSPEAPLEKVCLFGCGVR